MVSNKDGPILRKTREYIVSLLNTHTAHAPVKDEFLHKMVRAFAAKGWTDELRLALTLPKSPVE